MPKYAAKVVMKTYQAGTFIVEAANIEEAEEAAREAYYDTVTSDLVEEWAVPKLSALDTYGLSQLPG